MKKPNFSQTDMYRLIQEISRHRGGSVHSLAEKLNVKVPALQNQARKLRNHKLVSAGKVPGEISMNRELGYLIGIDMGASHLHFALADFSGEIIKEFTEQVHPEDGPRKTTAQIKKAIVKLVPAGKSSKIRALGIGVPSPIDPRTDEVILANNLTGWTNFNLKKELEKEFGIPVAIENDANMAAIGEHWRGVAQDVKNFIFIALGTGIGSGIFVNGQLYSGRTGGAGELRLLQVEWQRWQEDFGDTGYFETHASGQGIARLGRELISRPRPKSGSLAEDRDAFFVFRAFHNGNPQAREVLQRTFTILGVGIVNVLAVLDPDMVVLGGGITRGAPEFMLSIVTGVAGKIQPDYPPICLSTLEDKAHIYGAIFSAMMSACESALSQCP